MTRTGPNDVSRIVWAIGEYFFYFSSFFLNTNLCFMVYTVVIHEVRDREAGNDENGPK